MPGELKAWIGCLTRNQNYKCTGIRHGGCLLLRIALLDRFFAIKKYLHLADNSSMVDRRPPSADRLAKVRPLMNLLQTNFRSHYNPGRYLTADEDICKFKG